MNTMKIKNWFDKLIGLTVLTGSAALVGVPVLAQYYYPSSSFFQPTAFSYESDDPCYAFTDTKSTFENLKANPCLQTLASDLEKSGLAQTLQQQDTFTIFAPWDDAFVELPDATREKLSQPENLEKVMKYHVVRGAIAEADIKRREKPTMLEGDSVEITGVPTDGRVETRLDDAKAIETIKTSNGYIVLIDKVLLPQELKQEAQ